MSVSSALQVGKIVSFEDERALLRKAFLKAEGLEKECLIPLPVDASRRRYFRLPQGLLMDAPPPHEDTARFQFLAEVLREAGLTVPTIHAADHDQGFMLIEDFGDSSYRKALQDGIPETLLYQETINSLIHLHKQISTNCMALPVYDLEYFLDGVGIFLEWYDFPFTDEAKLSFKAVWEEAYKKQPPIPSGLILRDVMVDNLMWLPERSGFNRCGFIDFQDGLWGPISYDLVSLLEDARRDIAPQLAQEMIQIYFKRFPDLPQEDFWASYYLMGAQRSTRILGVFSRLARRDGKPSYLAHLPRLWKTLMRDLDYPSLRSLRAWFQQYMGEA